MYILYIVFCIQSGEHFVYKVGRGNICSFYLHKETLMGERFRREGTYAYLWLIHVAVWQKPMRYCKAIILQLKISINFKKKETQKGSTRNHLDLSSPWNWPACEAHKRRTHPHSFKEKLDLRQQHQGRVKTQPRPLHSCHLLLTSIHSFTHVFIHSLRIVLTNSTCIYRKGRETKTFQKACKSFTRPGPSMCCFFFSSLR